MDLLRVSHRALSAKECGARWAAQADERSQRAKEEAVAAQGRTEARRRDREAARDKLREEVHLAEAEAREAVVRAGREAKREEARAQVLGKDAGRIAQQLQVRTDNEPSNTI